MENKKCYLTENQKENLISEVQKQELLYNKSHSKYFNKIARKEAWKTISNEIGIDGKLYIYQISR